MMQLYRCSLKASAKEIHRFMRDLGATLVPPVITMTLLFYYFWQPDWFAHRLVVRGFSYMQFYCAGPDYDGGHY